jgi:predicted DNA-binding transcriptional regulator AlpA
MPNHDRAPRPDLMNSASRATAAYAYEGDPAPKLLNVNQAAERLGLSVSYLNKKRLVGGFIPFVKIGSSVKYDPRDIAAWVERQKRHSTSDDGSQVAK